MPNKIVDFVLGLVKGIRTKSCIWFFPLTPKEGGNLHGKQRRNGNKLICHINCSEEISKTVIKRNGG